jgi:hypothetical protein
MVVEMENRLDRRLNRSQCDHQMGESVDNCLEMKYRSELSASTVNNFGSKGYPSDQLIRTIRVGLYQCGWYDEPKLFEMPKRDFVVLLVSPQPQTDVVERYRDRQLLRKSIPHGELQTELPDGAFIGQLSYQTILSVLQLQELKMNWNERKMIEILISYLNFKITKSITPPLSVSII